MVNFKKDLELMTVLATSLRYVDDSSSSRESSLCVLGQLLVWASPRHLKRISLFLE